MDEGKVKIKIFRYDPQIRVGPRFDIFEVPYFEGMRVLDALIYIQENIDPTLAFRYECKVGRCGSCTVLLNGNTALACKTNIHKGEEITVEPITGFSIIRDLVVDLHKHYESISRLGPLFFASKTLPKVPAQVHEAQLSDLIQVSKCIECLSCNITCPVTRLAPAEYVGPMHFLALAQAMYNPLNKIDHASILSPLGLYDCLTCGLCAEVCPMDIELPDVVTRKLRTRVAEKGFLPIEIEQLSLTLHNQHNIFERPLHERFKWVYEKVKIRERAEKILFVGCVAEYRRPEVVQAAVKIFDEVGVDFAMLGNEEWCCGYPALSLGLLPVATELAKHNVEKVEKSGAKEMVTLCPGCYRNFKAEYPRLVGQPNFEVVHVTELLSRLVDEGKIKFKQEVKWRVTYHDPCDLGRRSGIFDSPRKVITSIPGIELIEMPRHRELALCCGAGGGVRTTNTSLALKIAEERIKEAETLGINAIVSACPTCEWNLQTAVKRLQSNLRVIDLTELLTEAMNFSHVTEEEELL